MQTVIIVIHLMVVATMIGVVLLQKSEGGGLGIGSTGGFLADPHDCHPGRNLLCHELAALAPGWVGA